ncbi:hypothetical protein BX600DRAFT_505260 [Xylariales sp. PMI_506]|nr:hypothetical protein BX600DRAFT_505260 [Xylariales sp. PMI_506]
MAILPLQNRSSFEDRCRHQQVTSSKTNKKDTSGRRGDIILYRSLRAKIKELAQLVYGEESVDNVGFGRVGDASPYILVKLRRRKSAHGAGEPPAALNADLYEVLRGWTAHELLGSPPYSTPTPGLTTTSAHCQQEEARFGMAGVMAADSGGDRGSVMSDQSSISGMSIPIDDLPKRKVWYGMTVPELFEILVDHPINGRLRVGPAVKQGVFIRPLGNAIMKRFRGRIST